MSLPLIERGYEVHLIARKRATFTEQYKSFLHYDNFQQCIDSIRMHVPGTDIFHVHNEPSWFVCAIKELTDIPVVLDVHDTYLTRSTPEQARKALDEGKQHVRVTNEERNAMQVADAFNFVSKGVRDACQREFKLHQPSNVLPSYVPAGLYRYCFKEWWGGLVYEGRVTLPWQHEQLEGGTGAHYCDYLEVAEAAKRLKMDFHIYAGKDDKRFREVYEPLAFVHRGVPYTDLLDQITRHDWGLVGNTVKNTQWDVAMPNKLFDYIAAGVPSVCIGAAESSELVEQHGFGITVESIDELAERWREHRQCRAKLWKARRALSMDAHIHSLERLYEEVIK